MYTCKIYGKTYSSNSVSQLLRLASRRANNYRHVIDTCEITDNKTITCVLMRINKIYPNGMIERDKWMH